MSTPPEEESYVSAFGYTVLGPPPDKPGGSGETRLEPDPIDLDRLFLCAARAPRRAEDIHPGKLLRALRRRLKVPQKTLARLIGSRQAYISRFEAGKVDAKISFLARALAALHCKLVLLPRATTAFDEACAANECSR